MHPVGPVLGPKFSETLPAMRTDSLNWWAWIIGIREEKE
jgi:hypothetical protein